jgi:GTP-binding protein
MSKCFPKVVLVGRTNVGKSALFNRLSDKVRTIVFEREGVTRDYVHEVIFWQGKSFDLVDSGGIPLHRNRNVIDEAIHNQVLALMDEAAVILFVCDVKNGLTDDDRRIANLVHKAKGKAFLLLNKSDNKDIFAENSPEFYTLGFEKLYEVSALHGVGIAGVLDAVAANTTSEKEETTEHEYKVVLLGKPNVGKSSLMNMLLQKDRSIISDIPGTTREAISETLKILTSSIQLTDTAGVRKQNKIDDSLESLMVKSSFASVRDADIVILMADASQGRLSDQELKLLFYAHENRKGIVLVINKSDLLDDYMKDQWKYNLSQYEFITQKIPQVWVSCLEKKNIHKIIKALTKLWEQCKQTFDDEVLHDVFKNHIASKPLYRQTQALNIKRIVNVKDAKFPTFMLHVKQKLLFNDTHIGFVENVLRNNYNLQGCPVKIILKEV